MQQKRFMHIIDLICVICLARLGFTATVPLAQSIDSSPVDPLSANIPSVGANIDSRFHIEFHVGDILVNENDCLMNLIIAMGYLSAGEFMRPIEPTRYRDPRYPSVFIVIRGPDVGGRDRSKPAFFSGASILASDQGSNSTDFLIQRPTKSSNLNATSSHTNTAQPAPPNPTTAIKVETTSFGAALPKIDIVMAVLECLLYLARRSSDEVLLAFSVTPYPHNVVLRLQPICRNPFSITELRELAFPPCPRN
ncbi:MAG: hypothetical protein ALECFALPRED_008009 [Alectoria fallacina]|uniref:Uncharacterized protein n=1 Tax=Alectoria fallacina TaxID=1903189 RepID=A0A8H3J229_9LECA|nr:MAG: hypothetical protein ALECFALPRED_008009 [Alectoria fallacina]